jgi:hypothetical protein
MAARHSALLARYYQHAKGYRKPRHRGDKEMFIEVEESKGAPGEGSFLEI